MATEVQFSVHVKGNSLNECLANKRGKQKKEPLPAKELERQANIKKAKQQEVDLSPKEPEKPAVDPSELVEDGDGLKALSTFKKKADLSAYAKEFNIELDESKTMKLMYEDFIVKYNEAGATEAEEEL